ncbi:MAG: DNA cytosine methyltransferase [Gammaproteobacteria bacterium]|nr:DNA cytosine methyltransferase [Gammaproteobacteria bacterium]
MDHADNTAQSLTVRDYARMQTFPDDWQFCGSLIEQYRQIGDAVPVNLATAMADAIKDFLDRATPHTYH